MGAYFTKRKGWRYDFMLKGQRITGCWFKTKGDARQAEAARKEEIMNPPADPQTPTGMAFWELVNRRLDHVQAYDSASHYKDYRYMAKRWIKNWGHVASCEITGDMIEKFVLERARVSAHTANKEIRYLRATFRFGQNKNLITGNPVKDIGFLPTEKRVRYVPQAEDIDKVIAIADQDVRDYLLTIRDTLGRMSEINRLTWDDVRLENKSLVLYTRKKKGGHLTPRMIPMTNRLFQILSRRYAEREKGKPWVFWHRYWNHEGEMRCGPFTERKRIMKTLCRKAGVKYFRYHALRHAGASVMDRYKVPIGAIQRILGHENRTTTEIYLHSIADAEREAISVLERFADVPGTNSHTDSHTGLNDYGRRGL